MIRVERVDGEQWKQFAGDAHRAVFDEIQPPEYERIDFAILAVSSQDDRALGYITLRELDQESVYLKYGGTFDIIRGTKHSYEAYLACLRWLLARYKRLTTLVENTNKVYLKMAISAGFTIIGIRNFKGSVLVELFMEEK